MSRYYIRNDDNSVTLLPEWKYLPAGHDAMRDVDRTNVGNYEVCTRFLFQDYWGDPDSPVLWESYVYGDGPWRGETRRYHTYDEAVDGHAKLVEDIKAMATQDAEIRELHAKAYRLRNEMLKSRRV